MKKPIKLLLLFITIGLFSFVNISLSKYVFNVDEDVTVTSGAFYFESNATNVTVPISNPTFTIDVDNYLGSLYTEYNIDYKISISDGNGVHDDYNFSINGGSDEHFEFGTVVLKLGTRIYIIKGDCGVLAVDRNNPLAYGIQILQNVYVDIGVFFGQHSS